MRGAGRRHIAVDVCLRLMYPFLGSKGHVIYTCEGLSKVGGKVGKRIESNDSKS